eukprot:UN02985
MECQDLRAPVYLGDGDLLGENMFVVSDKRFDEKEEIIINKKVYYFGNVFIMTVISVIVLIVFGVYYRCCFTDKDEDGIDKYLNSIWHVKNANYSAYGSL